MSERSQKRLRTVLDSEQADIYARTGSKLAAETF